MGCDHVAAPVGDTLDRGLEGGVLERLDLAAVVADEVMVVLTGRVRALEARDAVPEVDPLGEAGVDQPLDRPVHAREPDPRALRAHAIVDLLYRQAAVLAGDEVDDDAPRAAAPTARGA